MPDSSNSFVESASFSCQLGSQSAGRNRRSGFCPRLFDSCSRNVRYANLWSSTIAIAGLRLGANDAIGRPEPLLAWVGMSASFARDDEGGDRECNKRESVDHQFATLQRRSSFAALDARFSRGTRRDVLGEHVKAAAAVVAAVRPVSRIRDQPVKKGSCGAADSDAAAARALMGVFVF